MCRQRMMSKRWANQIVGLRSMIASAILLAAAWSAMHHGATAVRLCATTWRTAPGR